MSFQKNTRFFGYVTLACIVLLAFFLRIYNIENIPSSLYPDEAVNATDAMYANETGNYLLFYENNYGREGLFINLQALALKVFGPTILALKLWSIIFGTLTVLGLYFLAQELFKRRVAGLIAAFITATSFWAINFSRIGFRAIMTSFLLSFSFFFFFRGLRTRRFIDFVLSGLFFGLGLHTYVAFRLAPLILIILFPALLLSYEAFIRRYWKHALTFFFAAFVSASPMLYHFFVSHPQDFASRSAAVSIFSPEINHGNFWGTLGKTFGLSLIKYNFFGDQNWRHNYPPYPILDPFVGTLFLAGFLYIIWQTIMLLGRRIRENDRDTRLVRNVFLLGSFFVMLMPEFLTNEGLPHALRSIGTQMPVFLFATLPAFWIIKKTSYVTPIARAALLSLLIIFFGLSALFNTVKYFVFFAQNPAQTVSFNLNYRNISEYILTLPKETHKYVVSTDRSKIVGNRLPINVQPIVFFTSDKVENLMFLLPDSDMTIPTENNVIIFASYDQHIIDNLLDRIPGAHTETVDLRPGTDSAFTIVRFQ